MPRGGSGRWRRRKRRRAWCATNVVAASALPGRLRSCECAGRRASSSLWFSFVSMSYGHAPPFARKRPRGRKTADLLDGVETPAVAGVSTVWKRRLLPPFHPCLTSPHRATPCLAGPRPATSLAIRSASPPRSRSGGAKPPVGMALSLGRATGSGACDRSSKTVPPPSIATDVVRIGHSVLHRSSSC